MAGRAADTEAKTAAATDDEVVIEQVAAGVVAGVPLPLPSGLHREAPPDPRPKRRRASPDAVFEPPPPPKTRWTRFIDAVRSAAGEWGRTPFSASEATLRSHASEIRKQGFEVVVREKEGAWYLWARSKKV